MGLGGKELGKESFTEKGAFKMRLRDEKELAKKRRWGWGEQSS